MSGLPASAPLIAITARRLEVGRIDRWLEAAVASPVTYSDAVTRAGGRPLLVPPAELGPAGASELLAAVDGLVLTGGIDVDPARYGQQPRPETYGLDPVTDQFELDLLAAALAEGVPTLAICRGLQVLNVARGGTLQQHITGRPGLGAHGIPNGGGGSLVEVSVVEGSRLHATLGTSTLTGLCHHHQAVDRLGDGLTVVARSADGLVEAVEPTDVDGWVLAVQWHPEDSAAGDPLQQRLFDTFVAAAATDERFTRRRLGSVRG